MKLLQFATLLLVTAFAGCAYLAPPDLTQREKGTAGDPYGVVSSEGSVQLIRNGVVVRTIRTAEPNVIKWGFTPDGRELVVKSSPGQGPATVELFKVSDGTQQQKISASAIKGGQPEWAAGYAD